MSKRTLYHPTCCDKMIEYMAKGLKNYEVAAKFRISMHAFDDWKKRWPEFQEAYEVGDTCRKAYYASEARQCWKDEKDKGFKYFAALAGAELGFNQSPMATNQININNLNVLNQKSEVELLEILQGKLQKIDLPLLEATIIKEDENNG